MDISLPSPSGLSSVGRLLTFKKLLADHARSLHSTLLLGWITRFRSTPLPVSKKTTVVIAPHQDDETLGCGGLIALKKRAGVSVHVIFVTDGAASHGAVAQDEKLRLIETRRTEALAATAILGLEPKDVTFLDLQDGCLGLLGDGMRTGAVSHLAALLRDLSPGEIFLPHRSDRHPDHEATFALVQAAIAGTGLTIDLFQYVIWGIWWSGLGTRLHAKDLTGARILEIASVMDLKRKAIAVYRSQLAVLPKGFVRRFDKPVEIYFEVNARS